MQQTVRTPYAFRLPAAQLLRVAVIAGLVAGLAFGAFQFFVGEPLIERAILLEEQMAAAGEHHEDVYSRQTQQAGLIGAAAAYGVGIGLIFGGIYAYARRAFPHLPLIAGVALLAGVAAWVVAVTPAIKFPADPPGVGDPATVYLRQGGYLGLILLNILALIGAELLRRKLWGRISPRWASLAIPAALYAVVMTLLLVFIPAHPSESAAPSDLLWQFRAASLGGQVLFWAVLGAAFVYLMRREAAVH